MQLHEQSLFIPLVDTEVVQEKIAILNSLHIGDPSICHLTSLIANLHLDQGITIG